MFDDEEPRVSLKQIARDLRAADQYHEYTVRFRPRLADAVQGLAESNGMSKAKVIQYLIIYGLKYMNDRHRQGESAEPVEPKYPRDG